MTDKITAYKAFDENWQCRGFQYEVGQTYQHEGDVQIYGSGFHACEVPFDCWNYYDLIGSKLAKVEMSDDIARDGGDSKIASAKIIIVAEMSIGDWVKDQIEFVKGLCSKSKDDGQLAASGNYSQLAASGNYSQLAASGNYSKLAASGDDSQLAASGYNSQLAASGDDSKLAASGNYSQLAASGYNSQLAASGNYSQLAASGDDSKLAASGYNSQLAASGDDSKLAASGNYSQLAASGDDSVCVSSGINAKVKGIKGTVVALTLFDDEYKPVRVVPGIVGQEGLKPDTWYTLDKNGNFVETE